MKLDTKRKLMYLKSKRFWVKYCYEPIYGTPDKKYILLKCTKTLFNLIKPSTIVVQSVAEILKFKDFLKNDRKFPFENKKSEIYITLLLEDNKTDWLFLNYEETVDFFEAYKIGLKLSGGI